MIRAVCQILISQRKNWTQLNRSTTSLYIWYWIILNQFDKILHCLLLSLLKNILQSWPQQYDTMLIITHRLQCVMLCRYIWTMFELMVLTTKGRIILIKIPGCFCYMRIQNVEQKYHKIEIFPIYNRKYIQTKAKSIPLSHLYMAHQYNWLGRGSSTKSGGYN